MTKVCRGRWPDTNPTGILDSMPILHLLLIDASGVVVGQPTPRQWVAGIRLADGRRSIEIDGATFTMESQRMSVMQLRSKLDLEPAPE